MLSVTMTYWVNFKVTGYCAAVIRLKNCFSFSFFKISFFLTSAFLIHGMATVFCNFSMDRKTTGGTDEGKFRYLKI